MKMCNFCNKLLNDSAIDGATIYGPWAWMCVKCHILIGMGLGIGRSQKYKFVQEKGYVQVEGGSQKGMVIPVETH